MTVSLLFFVYNVAYLKVHAAHDAASLFSCSSVFTIFTLMVKGVWKNSEEFNPSAMFFSHFKLFFPLLDDEVGLWLCWPTPRSTV